MLVALADTHADTSPELAPHLRERVEAADVVCHAGDFTSSASLSTVESLSNKLVAVHGNADSMAVRQRLPRVATVDHLGRRFLLAHGHEHDRTALSLLARQEDADVVIVGHTHRARTENSGDRVIVNPGSHADPRGSRPAYFEASRTDGGVVGELAAPDGDRFERVRL